VHVVQAPLAAHEDLVERPLPVRLLAETGRHTGEGNGSVPTVRAEVLAVAAHDTACWERAKAVAASRTHAPSSCARRRCAVRWALHGPEPLTTA
jgi:hypothetical protein